MLPGRAGTPHTWWHSQLCPCSMPSPSSPPTPDKHSDEERKDRPPAGTSSQPGKPRPWPRRLQSCFPRTGKLVPLQPPTKESWVKSQVRIKALGSGGPKNYSQTNLLNIKFCKPAERTCITLTKGIQIYNGE